MICNHKFYKYLQLENLDFEPEYLFVGTFNPEWPLGNYSKWFYGRTDANFFWEVLPRLFGKKSLLAEGPEEWKAFCKTYKVAITDLISTIKNVDMNAMDHKLIIGKYGDNEIVKHFKNDLVTTPINNILANHLSIKTVCLTRRADGYWKTLWNDIKSKADKGIEFLELFTPSRYASYETSKFRMNNLDIPMSIPDFILKKWEAKLKV